MKHPLPRSGMGLVGSVVLTAALLAGLAAASPEPVRPVTPGDLPREAAPSGAGRLTGAVQVKFHANARDWRERDALHKESRSELVYRSRTLPYDVVRPTVPFRPELADSLAALCQRYRKSPLVEDCAPDLVPEPHAAGPLGPEAGASAAPERTREADVCPLTDAHGDRPLMGGKLSPHWGREFAGVDLAADLLKTESRRLAPVRIGTWEDVDLLELPAAALDGELVTRRFAMANSLIRSEGRGIHGTAVAALIASGQAGDTLPALALSPLLVMEGGPSAGGRELYSLDRALQKRVKLFQVSTSASNGDVFRALTRAGVISVRSAGNTPAAAGEDRAAPEESIVVGQLSPVGGMASTSAAFPEVTLAAPGEVYARIGGKRVLMSGTSGAQALVSGCLANAISLLPDLSPREARELLVRTATPTLNSRQEPRLNGSGTLNCFKLASAALRLAKDWPRTRGRVFNDPALYDFSAEAARDWATASAMDAAPGTCARRAKLDLLRRSFLLDPSRAETRREIASLYEAAGLGGNAVLYESLGAMPEERLLALYQQVVGTPYERDLIRLAGELSHSREILSAALRSEKMEHVLLAASYSRGANARANAALALIAAFDGERVAPSNADAFLSVYFDGLGLPSHDLLNVCREKLPAWSGKAGGGRDAICFKVMDRDPKVAKWFIWNQIENGPAEMMRAILGHYGRNPPPAYAIEVLASQKDHSRWTTSQRALIRKLTGESPNGKI